MYNKSRVNLLAFSSRHRTILDSLCIFLSPVKGTSMNCLKNGPDNQTKVDSGIIHSHHSSSSQSQRENNTDSGSSTSHAIARDLDGNHMEDTSCAIEVDIDTTYPHDAWEERYSKQFPEARHVKQKSLVNGPEPQGNVIRFVCMSDTHGRIERVDFCKRVPHGDVLLHAGDFTMYSELNEYVAFNDFLAKLPHKVKLAIPGNHEIALDPRGFNSYHTKLRRALGSTVAESELSLQDLIKETKSLVSEARILIDEMVEICGIKIYGLPWLPQYGLHGFGLSRGKLLLNRYNNCPAGIDILLSHGPPLGFGDFTLRRKHVGCVELLNSVTKRIKPKYVVSGHIHEGYGIQTDGKTTYINCATCNKDYRPSQDPIVFDYVLPDPYTREDLELLSNHDLQVTKPWKEFGSQDR
ncbi:metallophosphoesterase mpped2 [Plakobranchus ocellatus]|uniref:Metallophosphoesterase mpped2 n=1 Tax=Plakobranchus ocellatus TaxID=259542 RepID=A0AAV3YM46_9GAST|nr:metallophosphoesterase mpped2 [Plakobranchus ocellatus]